MKINPLETVKNIAREGNTKNRIACKRYLENDNLEEFKESISYALWLTLQGKKEGFEMLNEKEKNLII